MALCYVLSGLLHAGLLLLLVRWFEPRPRPPRDEITYLDLTLPDEERPSADEAHRDPEQPRPRDRPRPDLPDPEEKKKRKEKDEPDIELEELEKPEEEEEEKPEEEKPEEKPPEEQEPVHFVLEQLKMVEQPDELDEKDVPEEYNYLSNVNRAVEKETRSKVSNLERDAVKPEAHQIEPSPVQDQGTADAQKVAQAQEQESKLEKKATDRKPSTEERRTEQNDPQRQSLLSMRELERRDHQIPQESYEALASEAADGQLRPNQEQMAAVTGQEQQAKVDRKDKKIQTKLSKNDLDALYGKDPHAKKNVESQRQSKTPGVWEQARAHWQSPLENMVPEVQPGNQTALGSRKHPFARYIATMHRAIHDAWAWGFLEQLDTRGRDHPLNDYKLWTRVEIVLNGDGTIDSVKTVRFSGKLQFDAAAREIIHAVGPFPDPPREIISGNGKIYIHWTFHRDERACGTFGAQPFILDATGMGDRPDPNVEVQAGRGAESMPRLRRGGEKAGKKTVPDAPAPGPASPPGHAHGHGDDDGHAHGPGGHPEPPQGGGAGGGENAAATDPKVKKTADAWLYYFAEGAIDEVVGRSSLPFYSGDTVAARTRNELSDVLSTMHEEAKSAGRPKGSKVYTAAGLRKVFGSVPAGVAEGSNRIYALTKIGGEYVVLILEKKFGSWRVVGVTR